MRLKKKGWAAATAVVILSAIGGAMAQTAPPPATTPPPADVGARRDVALSPQQMLSEGEKYLPEMDRGATIVRRQLERRGRRTQACVETDVLVPLRDTRDRIGAAAQSRHHRVAVVAERADGADAGDHDAPDGGRTHPTSPPFTDSTCRVM